MSQWDSDQDCSGAGRTTFAVNHHIFLGSNPSPSFVVFCCVFWLVKYILPGEFPQHLSIPLIWWCCVSHHLIVTYHTHCCLTYHSRIDMFLKYVEHMHCRLPKQDVDVPPVKWNITLNKAINCGYFSSSASSLHPFFEIRSRPVDGRCHLEPDHDETWSRWDTLHTFPGLAHD